ncbi:G-protein coupled receptor [Phytophthora sojae]|uniref:G-protein coupled receptor n=1 Tax=Phytophthora sojae (strain P6497) TaxID=1094619 RepID=G4YSW3_PHYSP|nr:G-protein coupled receptor [Phytophthora sojae]EGZ25382.1 G-protein coupled receptor [Phytophthora sojae]|eukprot:XP_009520670.1 G-protein coupled receptor [Phytophthora sojae]
MADTAEPEPYFRAACNWVKANYDIWSDWMDRLPLCTFEDHIVDHVTGCENDSTIREIQFAWRSPNPGNAALPNNCDGGVDVLPETIETSRSCDWIFENRRIWSGWVDTKPSCDSTFYDYNVSDCDSDTHRTVTYFWKLPYASNAQYSAECSGGDTLPDAVVIDCEYMPTSSPTFAALTVLALIVFVLLFVAIIVVFKQRNAPIIRRSQFEMLLLMIFGGFFTTGAAIAYAGRPSRFLCGVRPVLICMGFTTIFGSLVIKSLRVYRVFMRSAMKRVKVTLFRILKILSIFYVGDIVIFVAWFGADFPEPTATTEEATEFRGTVDRISCSSSSFIFTALLIFWKAILLVLGLYLSFLIRNVSVDFQESPWIFGSVVVVLVGCLVIMPMTYLVTMRASTFYVFLALALIICTILIMGLMLVPKLFRLKEVTNSSTTGTNTGNSMKSRNSMVPMSKINNTNLTNLTNASENETNMTQDASRKASQKYQYQVRPLGVNSTIADEGSNTTNY